MKRTEQTAGTFLQGHIETTRAELTRIFGEPTQYEEGDKVTLEWGILFEDGTIATIYDWKRYELGTPTDSELLHWHIGGLTARAVALVKSSISKKISRSLFVEGREWFDKVNGNSYFSARLWVDGGQVAILPFQYGYGDQFLYEAQKKLLELGYISQEEKNASLWSIGKNAGFDFYSSKSETNKRDMFKIYENYSERVAS
jgi:hypothetical protein